MNCEVIVIGDEILIGQVVDTNSGYIGKQLNEIGVEVMRVTAIRDREEEIKEAIKQAFTRVNLILVTGGLGPTNDDITKITLCKMFGGELQFSPETQRSNDRLFAMRNREMNHLTRSQAMLPNVCTIIPNPHGTAPAMHFKDGEKELISMPGVPSEMRNILDAEVVPMLKSRLPEASQIIHATRVVIGYTESKLAIHLADFESSLPAELKLAYLPKIGIIRLRLTARGGSVDTLKAILNSKLQEMDTLIGDKIVAKDDCTPEEILGRLLQERSYNISTAESCTGGAIASLITSVAGASNYYKGSVVSYSNEVKISQLGVAPATLDRCGAVSLQVAEEMAKGAARNLDTEFAISTSGVAGPNGGTDEKPVGTVAISIYNNGVSTTKLHTINPSNRQRNIQSFTSIAIIQAINALKNNS